VFSISPSLPTGLSLSASTGSISGTPTTTQAPTSYTITVTDDVLTADNSKSFSLAINLPDVVTTTVAQPTVTFFKTQTVTPVAPVTAGGGYGTITFSISPALPSGLSFNASNGRITGTPTVKVSGSHTVTATDSIGQTSSSSFSLVILNPPLVTTADVPDKTLIKGAVVTPFKPVSVTGG